MDYYHDKQIKNTGSAWAFLFKVAGCFILFCLIPYIALECPYYDKIDKWSSSVEGNLIIVFSVVSVLGIIVFVSGKRWWENNS